jgi:cell division protease FtsH
VSWRNLFNKNSNNNNNNNDNGNSNTKWYIVGALALGMAYMSFSGEDEADQGGASLQNPNGISYNDLLAQADDRNISGVAILGNSVIGTTRNGEYYVSSIPNRADPLEDFNALGTPVTNIPIADNAQAGNSGGGSFLMSMLPFALMIGVWIYFMRRMQPGGGGGGGGAAFGKSKAKLLTQRNGRVTFDDVAGADQAKEDMQEVVDFLREPHKYSSIGAKIPKGTLLEGPPGTGKTLLARAVAGEAGVPFYQVAGSDFVEMFVGVGASRVRDMFAEAKKNAPCIIFIDEIDAVGRARGSGHGGGNDEREQTLNQLLVEMDGFEANEGVVLMAATNRKDVLDPALLRPGRFDRKITVPQPDITARESILGVHARKVPLAPDVNLRDVARNTPGFSGADLANLVNESALLAARVGRRKVTMFDFDEARDRVLMGAENRSLVLSNDMKEAIAYHESGHAVLASHFYQQGKHDPVYKGTIVPRGGALGMVVCVPESDKVSMSKEEYEAKLVMTMAGRAAERIKYGEQRVTSGPQSDIQQASNIARTMVMKFGMSDLGSVDYGDDPNNPYKRTMSPETQREIDEVVKGMVKNAEQEAYDLMKPADGDTPAGELNEQWESIAKGFLEFETLNHHAVMRIMDGKPAFEPAPKPEDFFGPPAPEASNDNEASAPQSTTPKALTGGIPKVNRKPPAPSA